MAREDHEPSTARRPESTLGVQDGQKTKTKYEYYDEDEEGDEEAAAGSPSWGAARSSHGDDFSDKHGTDQALKLPSTTSPSTKAWRHTRPTLQQQTSTAWRHTRPWFAQNQFAQNKKTAHGARCQALRVSGGSKQSSPKDRSEASSVSNKPVNR